MDIELVEISDFLAEYHPFDLLPEEVLRTLPASMQASYARRGMVILEPETDCAFLHVVRSGAVEAHSREGHLLARLGEGEAFGSQALIGDGKAINRITAIEDTLLYLLPKPQFDRLRRDFPQFSYFFAPPGAERLRGAHAHGRTADEQLKLMAQRLGDLMERAEPVVIGLDDSIQAAAARMRDENVSCLPVCDSDRLVGIITDRDLRNRVVAGGVDYATPVRRMMTSDPVTLDADDLAFDALMTMSRRNISHLPIMSGGRLAGVITNTNLVRRQTLSAVYMVGDIHQRTTFDGLAGVVSQIPHLLVYLVDAGATAHNIGHIITSIADAATQRLLKLAEEELGPPPVPYAWMASGSQARHEQTGVSDQDNCLILDDSFDAAAHGDYFTSLARYVNDGLHACGYVYCPGDMMASTPKWRQPLAQWRRYFSKWIDQPEPKALMLSCIFFDMRPVWGEKALFTDLQGLILDKAQKNQLFLSHMVANALTHSPPIGFFRGFVLIRGGEHDNEFDLKHAGVVPVVDIARINALEEGLRAVNTHDRLNAERRKGSLSTSGARDLLESYEFIAITRLRHQAEQIRNGEKPNNFMDPNALSRFERDHLRDAFQVVKTIQSSMANAYHVTM